MLTPVGRLTKDQTRAYARRLGLATADKAESVEICFVPDGDYAAVLERRFARYTIGQRRGLPGGYREPRYVVAIRPDERAVVIGGGAELAGHRVTLEEVNWLASPLEPDAVCQVQIRYRSRPVPATVLTHADHSVTLALGTPARGGGIIA
jgi:tRNA-specific 2-thiouridylase